MRIRGALNCKEWMKGNKTMKQLKLKKSQAPLPAQYSKIPQTIK